MPNTDDCLDSRAKILKSLEAKRLLPSFPVSALTIGRKGEKLVEIEKIADLVVGFSDDGDCLNNLSLLTQALETGVLVMAHLEPEVQMTEKYLKILERVGGRLHIQHVSKKETVSLIRRARQDGLRVTAETCPQYFTFSDRFDDIKVNPPLGDQRDILEIKKGLKEGVIDCIVSDYAPKPRPRDTGLASFDAFLKLSYGLVLDGTLTLNELEDKLSNNPRKIVCESGLRI
jgi:dihydroorotase